MSTYTYIHIYLCTYACTYAYIYMYFTYMYLHETRPAISSGSSLSCGQVWHATLILLLKEVYSRQSDMIIMYHLQKEQRHLRREVASCLWAAFSLSLSFFPTLTVAEVTHKCVGEVC